MRECGKMGRGAVAAGGLDSGGLGRQGAKRSAPRQRQDQVPQNGTSGRSYSHPAHPTSRRTFTPAVHSCGTSFPSPSTNTNINIAQHQTHPLTHHQHHPQAADVDALHAQLTELAEAARQAGASPVVHLILSRTATGSSSRFVAALFISYLNKGEHHPSLRAVQSLPLCPVSLTTPSWHKDSLCRHSTRSLP